MRAPGQPHLAQRVLEHSHHARERLEDGALVVQRRLAHCVTPGPHMPDGALQVATGLLWSRRD